MGTYKYNVGLSDFHKEFEYGILTLIQINTKKVWAGGEKLIFGFLSVDYCNNDSDIFSQSPPCDNKNNNNWDAYRTFDVA